MPVATPPCFVIIDRVLRDEGTSYHYEAPVDFSEADPLILKAAIQTLMNAGLPAHVGASWTTDVRRLI
jgi:hypothetical protein